MGGVNMFFPERIVKANLSTSPKSSLPPSVADNSLSPIILQTEPPWYTHSPNGTWYLQLPGSIPIRPPPVLFLPDGTACWNLLCPADYPLCFQWISWIDPSASQVQWRQYPELLETHLGFSGKPYKGKQGGAGYFKCWSKMKSWIPSTWGSSSSLVRKALESEKRPVASWMASGVLVKGGKDF